MMMETMTPSHISSTTAPHHGGDDHAALRQAACAFEGLFLAQIMQPMFENLAADPLFGGGAGEETWQSFLVDEYGKELARKGGIGIADHLVATMLRVQESAQ